MKQYNNFYFEDFSFDTQTLLATFRYSFDEELFFEEKICFFDESFYIRKDLKLEIINNILFHIHIALWISYYKFYPTKKLIIKTGKLDDSQINFWKKFYLNWLGEFFYRNQINPNWLLNFDSSSSTPSSEGEGGLEFPSPKGEGLGVRTEKYLVPVGWWKDSIVSIELLKKMWKEIDLVTFAQNDNILYENTQNNSGLKRLFIKRELSKNILEVINSGAYNWHVPITWMIAFVLELASYLYDYKFIVLSNEKSANFWNTFYHWIEINHQWSKSLEFEKDFEEYVSKYISSSVKYFSLLRPFYELEIAKLFAKYWKKYFTSFSSCNTNFKIFKTPPNLPLSREEKKSPLPGGDLEGGFWCNSCPKCAFVYTILRPFLTKNETLSIFSKELYEDEKLEKLFRELAWISWIKPFECVWTNEEVVLAMKMALEKWEGNLPFILEIFQKEINSKMTKDDFEEIRKKVLIPDFKENLIPENLLKDLEKII